MSKHKLHSAKRPLAMLMAMLMVFALVPATALATGEATEATRWGTGAEDFKLVSITYESDSVFARPYIVTDGGYQYDVYYYSSDGTTSAAFSPTINFEGTSTGSTNTITGAYTEKAGVANSDSAGTAAQGATSFALSNVGNRDSFNFSVDGKNITVKFELLAFVDIPATTDGTVKAEYTRQLGGAGGEIKDDADAYAFWSAAAIGYPSTNPASDFPSNDEGNKITFTPQPGQDKVVKTFEIRDASGNKITGVGSGVTYNPNGTISLETKKPMKYVLAVEFAEPADLIKAEVDSTETTNIMTDASDPWVWAPNTLYGYTDNGSNLPGATGGLLAATNIPIYEYYIAGALSEIKLTFSDNITGVTKYAGQTTEPQNTFTGGTEVTTYPGAVLTLATAANRDAYVVETASGYVIVRLVQIAYNDIVTVTGKPGNADVTFSVKGDIQGSKNVEWTDLSTVKVNNIGAKLTIDVKLTAGWQAVIKNGATVLQTLTSDGNHEITLAADVYNLFVTFEPAGNVITQPTGTAKLITNQAEATAARLTDADPAWDWEHQSIQGAHWMIFDYTVGNTPITVTGYKVNNGTTDVFTKTGLTLNKAAGSTGRVGIEAADIIGAAAGAKLFPKGTYTITLIYTIGTETGKTLTSAPLVCYPDVPITLDRVDFDDLTIWPVADWGSGLGDLLNDKANLTYNPGTAANTFVASGVLRYVAEWEEFNSTVTAEQRGYYAAFSIKLPDAVKSITPSASGTVLTLGTGQNAKTAGAGCFEVNQANDGSKYLQVVLWRGETGSTDPFTFSIDWDGDGTAYTPVAYTIDFSGVVYKSETAPEVVPGAASSTVDPSVTADVEDLRETLEETETPDEINLLAEKEVNDLNTTEIRTEYKDVIDAADDDGIFNGEVQIIVQPFLDIIITGYEIDAETGTPILTLDIKAMYNLIAVGEDDIGNIDTDVDGNAIVLGDPQTLTVNTPVTIAIPITEGIYNALYIVALDGLVYINHVKTSDPKSPYIYNGKVYVAPGTIYYLEFKSTHGFSTFSVLSGNTKYTVSFDANNGKGTTMGDVETIGDYELPANTFTRSGYSFTGWKVGNKGDLILDEATITVVSDITLYAQWKSNGGSSSSSSGGGGGGTTETIKIATTTNGTVKASSYNPSKGATVTLTVTPKDGYELDSLVITDASGKELTYTDKGNGTFTFVYDTGTVTVTAKFKAVGTSGDVTLNFTDVSASDWFYDSVKFVVGEGLFNGTSATTFSPNASMTRAMFATVLARLEGADLSGYTTSRFSDVPVGQWYTASIEWAADNGIVGGIGDGKFDPDAEITREQMAVMLYRYIQYKGYTLDQVSDPNTFADDSQISSWAKEAVDSIQQSGLITGKPNNLFDPLGTATRAEVATLFARFVEALAA